MRIVRAWDTAAAVALTIFMVTVSLAARVTQPHARPPTMLGVGLLVLCGLALAMRRPWPRVAFVVAVGAASLYLGLRFAGWPVYIGAFAGLVALVSGVDRIRRWVPLAALGGVAVAVASGPPEGWQPTRLVTIALVWAAVAVVTWRAAQTRRRLIERESVARVVEERLRIARELHDVLSHSLASISLQAGVGLHLLDRQPEQAREALQTIRRASTDALTKARAALSVVRGTEHASTNPVLADLDAAVASVRAAGLGVKLDVDLAGVTVPDSIAAAAFHVVQEALTNAMRHAGPGAEVHARIALADGGLDIAVTDDGAGTSTEAEGSGHGLIGMAERVSAAGGDLRVGPVRGGGFSVRARLPLVLTR
jgi:signal transduction histidine kinase